MIVIKSDMLRDSPVVLREFLGYIQNIKGQSQKTVYEYFLDIRTFLRFIKLERGLVILSDDFSFDDISIKDVDKDFLQEVTLTEVYEYLNFTIEERHNNSNTRSRKISSLKTFFRYICNKTMLIRHNPLSELEAPKTKKSLPKYLTLEQSIELLNAVDGEFRERDYCILTLFLNCGLRLSELVGLNVTDIRSDNTMRVTGKGNKERLLYLNKSCMQAIKRYLKVRPNNDNKDKNALFISRLKKRMGTRAVQNMVEKYLAKIGLAGQGYSVHKLRHTAATLMYQHGKVDVLVLKEILGHENLSTTDIYTHLSTKELKDASLANPLSSVQYKTKQTAKKEEL